MNETCLVLFSAVFFALSPFAIVAVFAIVGIFTNNFPCYCWRFSPTTNSFFSLFPFIFRLHINQQPVKYIKFICP